MRRPIGNRQLDVPKSWAFSLIELLAVMAVIAILAVLAIPAVTSTLRASRLTTTGQFVVDELNLARQAAVSRNIPVEVRFYKLPDYNQTAYAPPSVYRALQSFTIQDGKATPLSKARFFPSPVILSGGASESPFLSSTNPEQASPAGVTVAGYGASYRYRSFQFTAAGFATIATAENSFTLVLQNDKPLAQGANFFTIQINPITGSVRHFRP